MSNPIIGSTYLNSTATHTGNISLMNDSLAGFEEKKMSVDVIVKLTFQVLLASFGAIGNTIVAIVIRKLGKRKKTGDFYLQNLAIADLGTLLLAFPLTVIKERTPLNWPFGEFGCRYLYPVPDTFFGASVGCIAVIAMERYRKMFTVRSTLANNNSISLKRDKTVASIVWVTSFLIFSFPLYFVVNYVELPNEGKWCGPDWLSWDHKLVFARVYIALLTFVSYILPLIVISYTYCMISNAINQNSLFLKAMKRSNVVMTEEHSRSRNTRLQQNKRAKNILTPVVLVFAVTMFPLNILRLIMVCWPAIVGEEYGEDLIFAVSILVVVNSSANPVIYSIVSRDFRKATKNICGRLSPGWKINLSAIFRFTRSTPLDNKHQGTVHVPQVKLLQQQNSINDDGGRQLQRVLHKTIV